MVQEKRRFVRIPEQSAISYRVLPSSKTSRFLTRDISQGGIGFFIKEFVPVNSLLETRLTLKKIPFSFTAIVKTRWIIEKTYNYMYAVGVEFTDIPEGTTRQIIAYIKDFLEQRNGLGSNK